MRPKWLFVVLLVAVCCGCAVRQADLTIVSTRNVDLMAVHEARKAQNPIVVTGYDVRHWVLFFPVTSPANLEDAIDDTMDRGNGDCMMDAVIYSYNWYIPFIYGQTGWKVKGRVLTTYGTKVEAQ